MHLVKLCVGISSVEELVDWRDHRFGGAGQPHIHTTRMTPKRADEIAGQGSLYWVIGGAIRCRQPIMELTQRADSEGRNCCDIIMAPDIIRTRPQPKRPFQGWRYLKPEDAPRDAPELTGLSEGDESLAEELADLGLI